MHVTFIAGYEWWPLSDPLITFVKYCVQKRISCSLIASPISDFIKNSYPTESEFTKLSWNAKLPGGFLNLSLKTKKKIIQRENRFLFFLMNSRFC